MEDNWPGKEYGHVPGETHWWVSSKRVATGGVTTNLDNIILESGTAPIFKKFIGQPIDNLRAWLSKYGTVDIQMYCH